MRTKSGNGKRKYEDDEMSERRVTRSFNSGKKSVHSSASTDEIDNNKPTTQRRIGLDGSYYECEMCDKVGRLLCCESCPRVYHLNCLGLEVIPEGHWECPRCCDDFSKPLKYLTRASNYSEESKPASSKLKLSSVSSLSKN